MLHTYFPAISDKAYCVNGTPAPRLCSAEIKAINFFALCEKRQPLQALQFEQRCPKSCPEHCSSQGLFRSSANTFYVRFNVQDQCFTYLVGLFKYFLLCNINGKLIMLILNLHLIQGKSFYCSQTNLKCYLSLLLSLNSYKKEF